MCLLVESTYNIEDLENTVSPFNYPILEGICEYKNLVRNGRCDKLIQKDSNCGFDVDDCKLNPTKDICVPELTYQRDIFESLFYFHINIDTS